MAVLVLHRGGFQDGLIYECDAEVPTGSTLTHESSSRPGCSGHVSDRRRDAELPTGEITAIAAIENEGTNHATVTAGLTA